MDSEQGQSVPDCCAPFNLGSRRCTTKQRLFVYQTSRMAFCSFRAVEVVHCHEEHEVLATKNTQITKIIFVVLCDLCGRIFVATAVVQAAATVT